MNNPAVTDPTASAQILRISDSDTHALAQLLLGYGIHLTLVDPDRAIPGSYWGDEEAGLIADQLMVRPDTPIHSALHEAAHYVCMDPHRRAGLHTNAGGDYDEENGVCYLQILWSEALPGMGKARMFQDMDNWGYSFRLGSARAWFENDAGEAKEWLEQRGIIHADKPTGSLRTDFPK